MRAAKEELVLSEARPGSFTGGETDDMAILTLDRGQKHAFTFLLSSVLFA
jgi:hypothetical protein